MLTLPRKHAKATTATDNGNGNGGGSYTYPSIVAVLSRSIVVESSPIKLTFDRSDKKITTTKATTVSTTTTATWYFNDEAYLTSIRIKIRIR